MTPVAENPIASVQVLLTMLLISSFTSIITRWVRIPYAVALVIAGLALGMSRLFPPIQMTPELVLLIFLPALLFEASWNLDLETLKGEWIAISALATVGVVLCTFAVAGIMYVTGGFDFTNALLFGAMISATDPVSVIALFRQLGMDKRLTMILEGESLFNDGTAVVLFQIMLATVATGAGATPWAVAGKFCTVVIGGGILGLVMGFIASRITRLFDDHLLEITLTMVTAYGSYLLAEYMHVSAIIAVCVAGIVLGNYGSKTGMSERTRFAVNSFWEYAAFFVNSLLFLLIGLQIQIPMLIKHGTLICLGVLAVLVARALVVYGICPFVSTPKLPISMKWRHLMFWGGLRGALVMALALSLPYSFAGREKIINTAYGVVLFTLLVPGLTIEPLLRLLKVPRGEPVVH